MKSFFTCRGWYGRLLLLLLRRLLVLLLLIDVVRGDVVAGECLFDAFEAVGFGHDGAGVHLEGRGDVLAHDGGARHTRNRLLVKVHNLGVAAADENTTG